MLQSREFDADISLHHHLGTWICLHQQEGDGKVGVHCFLHLCMALPLGPAMGRHDLVKDLHDVLDRERASDEEIRLVDSLKTNQPGNGHGSP